MLDIKRKLIEEIEKIDDNLVLEQLSQLVTQSDQNIEIQFSEDQINQIKESQIQIEKDTPCIIQD